MDRDFNIIDYEDRYQPELLAISMPWLTENDILEPADIEQLENPGRVLDGGGKILLAKVGDDIAGMMMLELFGNGTAEPFKFGVKEAYRNRGIGKALMQATIDAAVALGQQKLVLTSHHSLKAALHVYESFGFRYEDHDNVAFELSDISMVKDLSAQVGG